jgi:DNA-binding transcriptional LysR family regulator
MDLTDLKIFEAVARLGSMNRAAQDVHTVQSNVTARVRALEDQLGVTLFHRSRKGVVLTAAGQRLLPYARRFASLAAEAKRAARDEEGPAGPLIVGSLETTAALRLSPFLAAFAMAHPQVDLTLRTGTSAELVERVLSHELEGAFVSGPVQHPELEEETVFREELVLLSAPSHTTLEAALGAKDPRIVVLRAGCSYRLMLEAFLARRGIVGVRALEFGTLESIVACVSAGLGVTLLPRGLIGTVWQRPQVAVHTLPERAGEVVTVFIRRRDTLASSALSAFVARTRSDLARAEAAE